MQQLNDTERRILQVIDEEGVVRGSVLRRHASITDSTALLSAIQHLLDMHLMAVSGSALDERSMQSAYFSPVPSNRKLARQAFTKSNY